MMTILRKHLLDMSRTIRVTLIYRLIQVQTTGLILETESEAHSTMNHEHILELNLY